MTEKSGDIPDAPDQLPPWEREKLTPTQEHERMLKIFGAYTGFIAAGVMALVDSRAHSPSITSAMCLWIFSLPPLVSYLLLDYHVRVRQKRKKSATRGIMLATGFGLSNFGIVALLTAYSWVAAAIYFLLLFGWPLLIREVAGLGWIYPNI